MRAGLEAAKWRKRRPRKTAPRAVRTPQTLINYTEWLNSEQTHMTPTPQEKTQIERTERREADADKWVKDLKKKRIAESLARLSKKAKPAGKLPL